MKPNLLSLNLAALLLLFLVACGSGAGGPGPRTWIDAPLDGTTVELGPVIVISHAASEGGTAQAALMVNGEQVRLDEATDSSSPLVEFSQVWTPAADGEYTLQVITTDHAGNQGRSNNVRVIVGDIPVEATPAPGTQTSTPTATLTPTSNEIATPTITFTQNANCRLGDSTSYDVVTSFQQGQTLVIEGRNAETSWFWVLMPGGGHCWVAGSTGTLAGPYQTVPIIVPPPLPATDTPQPPEEGEPPAAPGNLHISGEVCNANEYTVTIEWNNVSGEDGYRVYRDGALIATLGANVTEYTDTPPNYQDHVYGVEAFNDSGSSARPTVEEDGCVF